jgi:hypothetical protein
VGKRGDRTAAKNRAREREKQRRQTGGDSDAEAAGPRLRFHPNGRPDFSNLPVDGLSAADRRKLKRTALFAFVAERARQAPEFLQWGLRPHPVEPGSRLALDDASVPLDDQPNLISSTARFPAMNASENLAAAAEVVALALTKKQIRTSAVSVLCRTAMESSANTIWLISERDPEERRRRCFGFIENERTWQGKFDEMSAAALEARTDALVVAQRVRFQKHREQYAKRLGQITALPAQERTAPPRFTKMVNDAAGWVDENMPRQPDPELESFVIPIGAKRFYSLGSGFVHGFKWAVDYVDDDADLLEMTLDAFQSALRMTECAVSLFEAQSVGPDSNPSRRRNYPVGLAETVAEWAPRYR